MTGAGVGSRRRSVLVIRNPAAGRRRARRFAAAMAALAGTGVAVRVADTIGPGDATRLAREVADDVARVVAAGGDGTISEVVQGLLDRPGDPPELAVIPLGTANVFALEHSIPLDPAAAGRLAGTGPAVAFRPGLANGRAFVQMVGVGFDARVVDAVTPAFKRRWGKLAYVFQALAVWWRFPRERFRVELPTGAVHEAGACIATKGRLYAGRYLLAPEADAAAAGFTLCLFPPATRWTALKAMLALPVGRLPRLAGLVRLATPAAVIHAVDGLSPTQADGDRGPPCPLTLSPAGRTIALVRPADAQRPATVMPSTRSVGASVP